MVRRARFHPGLDRKKRPVASSWNSRFRWAIPAPPPIAVASWIHVLQYTVAPDGAIAACSDQLFGAELPGGDDCPRIAAMPRDRIMRARGSFAGPITVGLRVENAVAGQTLPSVPATTLAPFSQRTFRFDVAPDGTPSRCFMSEGRPEGTPIAMDCAKIGVYLPSAEAHSIVQRVTAFTDGPLEIGRALLCACITGP
jgi:hypothetical protein